MKSKKIINKKYFGVLILRLNLPKSIFSRITRAVVEFELIDDNDKILIGISGGKDSLFLTYALALLRERFKKNFELTALTINPMFTKDFNVEAVTDFCRELNIEHKVEDVDIAGVIEVADKKPCFTCAYFRRAAMNRYANSIGANKVAYAHHLDDAVETFLMSILSSGQLNTFTPKTFLDRSKITVIRPLVYIREFEIDKFTQKNHFNIVKSPCPIDGKTNRQTVKELIKNLSKQFPDLFSHLTASMRKSSLGDLWEAPKTREEMKAAYYSYLGN